MVERPTGGQLARPRGGNKRGEAGGQAGKRANVSGTERQRGLMKAMINLCNCSRQWVGWLVRRLVRGR